MALDMVDPGNPLCKRRADRGRVAYLSGLSAEDAVVAHLTAKGSVVVARRWRGKSGEIDIVARDGQSFVVVEVKKSRTHDQAALSLGVAQQRRLWAAGEEFLGLTPRGSLSEIRFDLALVDATGSVQIRENVLMAA